MFQHQLPQVWDQVTFSLLQLWQEADCWELLEERISACWTLPVPRADQKPGGAPDSSPQPSLVATQMFSHSSHQIYSLSWLTAVGWTQRGLALSGWKD